MKIIKSTLVTILIVLANFNTVYADGSIVPIIFPLLIDETPAIYRCESRLLADLNGPGDGPYAVRSRFTNLGNRTIFFADHPDTGKEPWVTNGTPAGTHILKDIASGEDDSIITSGNDKEIIRVGSRVYFLADDGDHGEELWITDGTSSGTHMVADINAGSDGSWIYNLTLFNGKLYFLVANTHLSGHENNQGLWVSEGTSATTRVVAANPPTVGIYSGERTGSMVVLNNQLIFAAGGADAGYEVWQSDGTSAGTSLLKDINPGNPTSNPQRFAMVGNKVYFIADDGEHGRELWVSNGTSGGTRMVKDIYPGSESGATGINIDRAIKKNTGFNNRLYFVGRTAAEGEELWVTDGTNAGTQLVRDIAPGSDSAFGPTVGSLTHRYPLETAEVFNNKFYFGADDPVHGEELWRVNANGSTTLLDLNQGNADSRIKYLTANDNYLFFQSEGKGSSRQELSIMDKAGRVRWVDVFPGRTGSQPSYLHIRNDQSLLFVTNNSRVAPGVGLYQITCPVE
jgi:ELWxxDGT repeat protein